MTSPYLSFRVASNEQDWYLKHQAGDILRNWDLNKLANNIYFDYHIQSFFTRWISVKVTIVSEGEYIAEMCFLRSYTEALTCTCLDTIQSSSGQNIMLHSFAGNFSVVEQCFYKSSYIP